MSVGGRGVGVWVKVAWGERGHVIWASPGFSGLAAVGEHPHILFGIAQSLAKPDVVERYEVLRVRCRGMGWCGWGSSPFLILPRGAGAWGDKGGVGHRCGGRRLEGGMDWG